MLAKKQVVGMPAPPLPQSVLSRAKSGFTNLQDAISSLDRIENLLFGGELGQPSQQGPDSVEGCLVGIQDVSATLLQRLLRIVDLLGDDPKETSGR